MEGRLNRPAVFYLFLPPGSRKITDLRMFRRYPEHLQPLIPKIICHDQEPLCWDQYTDDQPDMQEHRQQMNKRFYQRTGIQNWLQLHDLNLGQGTCEYAGVSIFDETVLLHSEINSRDLQKYQSNGYAPAFCLSHAMIAQDWYRFAKHDARLNQASGDIQPFLIYSRGFTGSREYRPKFLERLVQMNLAPLSRISCLKEENNQFLRDFQPTNFCWRLDEPDLVLSLRDCQVPSTASADYDVEDIQNTACQIVLETRFDGDCLHFTEKTFRAIATAQPFMLLAAPGALALLRHYGFETYHGLIDESYDLVHESFFRMEAVLAEMARLSRMNDSQWAKWRAAAQHIAKRNQQRFFSDEFTDLIWDECINNIDRALDQVIKTRGNEWMLQRRLMRANSVNDQHSVQYRNYETIKALRLRQLRHGR